MPRRSLEYGQAERALRDADPVMRTLIDEYGPLDHDARTRDRPAEAYGALLRGIVGQQLSTKAARAIYGRMTALFGGHTPSPEELLAADPDDIRAAGLSRPKIAYLRDLAQHVLDGSLQLDHLTKMPDREVSAQLTAVKGLGQWTADMFLIFHLDRPDVVPVGDLGLRRAVERAYGLDGLPEPGDVERIAEPWRPYRSTAALYLWRSLQTEPV